MATQVQHYHNSLRRALLSRSGPLWCYLLLVTVAEYVTAVASTEAGLVMHLFLLVGLALHAALGANGATRRFVAGLMLAPLIRILSLSLPLNRFPQLGWYPIVAVPLLLGAWIIIRQLKLSQQELGLRVSSLSLQLGLANVGVVLGATEYYILAPRPQFLEPTWHAFAFAALNLLIFTGFSEELIFRGLLQSLGVRVLGKWTLVYVSLLFGVLHIGYVSLLDVLFVSGVGLLFAYIVRWTGSILGVTLAHGITNSMLFLVMPQLAGSSLLTDTLLPLGVFTISTLVALASLGVVVQKRLSDRPRQRRPRVGRRVQAPRWAARMAAAHPRRSKLLARRLGEWKSRRVRVIGRRSSG